MSRGEARRARRAHSKLDDDLGGLRPEVASVTSEGQSLAADLSSKGVEERLDPAWALGVA